MCCLGTEYHSLISTLVYMNFGIIKVSLNLSNILPLRLSLVRV